MDPSVASSTPGELSAIVGLGASAGGIGALKDFFSRVEPGSGMAYVVILHLSPDYDSKLAEVLQTATALPVQQVRQRTRIAADHIYVVPPNAALAIEDGHLLALEITRADQRRSPVDTFFRALGDAYGSRAVACVLSGTGPNGSNGIKRIKEYGGLVIAQDPNEAQYGDMPRNSVATGMVDLVLPIAEMPGRIAVWRDLQRASRSKAGPVDGEQAEALREILTLVRVRTGHDFANYKSATVMRRIERRLHLRGVETLAAYARLMREQPDEAVSLMKELLISVTSFFRDEDAFRALEERVIPRLFEQRREGDQVRVWVAGCATGEEAYSVAMLLAEYAGHQTDLPAIQVFATDLDEEAIALAREGLYTELEVADVSPARVQRFFQREAGGFRVKRELRELVLFAHHNLIKDPPFSHLDLVTCRNLLIYLNRSVQDRVIETFHFALRPGGYLFLGTSESADANADLFVAADKPHHIYESRSVSSRLSLPLSEPSPPATPRTPSRPAEARMTERVFPVDLHQRLLELYAPPSLVVNEEHSIVHVSEGAAKFLKVAPGEPSRDVMKLIHDNLRVELRTALHQAMNSRAAVTAPPVAVNLPEGRQGVSLSVRPALRDGDPARGFFLVLLQNEAAPPGLDAVPLAPQEPFARRLEEELARVKAQLRSTIEQYETHAEEAKAANEELQAMNEELRSAAEELETSQEELQSVNEELTTVNQELKIKIEELGLTNNDFQNLINSTDIGTIFLDRGLRVKLTTPRAQEVFNLLRTDIGRPLSDITHKLVYDELDRDVVHVLERLQTIEREVQTRDGRWYLMRVLPYRTTDDRIDGVVITFQDVSTRRRAEQRVRGSEERLRLLIDSARDYAIFTMTQSGLVDSWNTGAERMFGYSAAEMIGTSAEVLFTPEDRAAGVFEGELRTARDKGRAEDERYHVRKSGERFYCSGVTTRLGEGEDFGYAKIARDLTRQRQSELELQKAHAQMEVRVDERTQELRAEVDRRIAAQDDVTDLLRRVVTAQESERARIARDLHDHLGQQLTGLRLSLDRHRARIGAGASEDLAHAIDAAGKIDAEVDFLAWELRPAALDDLGLAAALPKFVAQWSQHYDIPAEFSGRLASGVLAPEAEVAFYRVAQEALNNISKHAHASRVDVLLEQRDDSVVMVVEDDGVGFEPGKDEVPRRGIGLAGMRERAALVGASLDIESSPGDGTAIYLKCPVESGARGA